MRSKLKELRGDLSVLELSRRSGVARNTIAALERGEGNPTVDTLYALADALGVPLASLLEAPQEGPKVVRSGEGAHVEGAALDAHLLERIDRPGLLGELYAIRFHPGAARQAPPHPVRGRGTAARPRRQGSGRSGGDRADRTRPGSTTRGTRARFRMSYEALRTGLGHSSDPVWEVAMKRAKRMDGVAGFGIDQVAAAITDPDVLRLENLDTDLPLPPEAVRVTREALDDPVSNSWLPFTGDIEPARGDLRPHRAAPRP